MTRQLIQKLSSYLISDDEEMNNLALSIMIEKKVTKDDLKKIKLKVEKELFQQNLERNIREFQQEINMLKRKTYYKSIPNTATPWERYVSGTISIPDITISGQNSYPTNYNI